MPDTDGSCVVVVVVVVVVVEAIVMPEFGWIEYAIAS
jgi:hypothetical protein